MLCSAPILSLREDTHDFVVYFNDSHQWLESVLMQRGEIIAHSSRQLKVYGSNYTTHDLDFGAVVFSLKIWSHYLHGTKCVVYTYHKSVKHIIELGAIVFALKIRHHYLYRTKCVVYTDHKSL